MACFDFEFKGEHVIPVLVPYSATVSVEAETEEEAKEKMRAFEDCIGNPSVDAMLRDTTGDLHIAWAQSRVEVMDTMFCCEQDDISDDWFLPWIDLKNIKKEGS